MNTRLHWGSARRAGKGSVALPAVAVGLLAVALTGCSGGSTAASASATTTTQTSSASDTPTQSASMAPSDSTATASTGSTSSGSMSSNSTSGTTATTAAVASSRCLASGTKVSAFVTPGGGAAGSYGVTLKVTNTSSRTCTLTGFPGVSMVYGDKGAQLGKAADRSGSKAGPVRVAPRASATTLVLVGQAANFEGCTPTPAKGLRVYLPDETHSQFAPLGSLMGCPESSVPTVLHVSSFGSK